MSSSRRYTIMTVFLIVSFVLVVSFTLVRAQETEETAEPVEAATAEVLQAHLEAVVTQDIDAIMIHYTDDSVVITADGVFSGTEPIREFFLGVLPLFTPEVLSAMTVTTQTVEGEYAYLLWSAGPTIPFATDTFHIRDGIILMQSFAGQIIID